MLKYSFSTLQSKFIVKLKEKKNVKQKCLFVAFNFFFFLLLQFKESSKNPIKSTSYGVNVDFEKNLTVNKWKIPNENKPNGCYYQKRQRDICKIRGNTHFNEIHCYFKLFSLNYELILCEFRFTGIWFKIWKQRFFHSISYCAAHNFLCSSRRAQFGLRFAYSIILYNIKKLLFFCMMMAMKQTHEKYSNLLKYAHILHQHDTNCSYKD